MMKQLHVIVFQKIVLVTLALLEHMPGQIQKIKLFMFSYQIEHILPWKTGN